MLKQVLQQKPSKAAAKSKQSQRQTLARRLPVFERVETSHHFVAYVTRELVDGMMR